MRLKIFLPALFLLFIFSSCGTFVYKSVSAKTPLFSKQHDFTGQLSLGGAGPEAYVAYAPLKFLGASVSAAGYDRTSDTALNVRVGKFRDLEMTLVPFYAVDNYSFEMPLGIGYTRITSTNGTFSPFSPYVRGFIQPTAAVRNENFDFAVFMRVSQVDYASKRWGVDTRYEPGIMLRGGSEKIKLMLQFRLDFGTNYSKTPEANLKADDQVLYFPVHIGFGVSTHLNFSKKNKPVSSTN